VHLMPILAVLLACAETPMAPAAPDAAPTATPPPPETPTDRPGAAPADQATTTLPTPFTLAQMKAGWVPGVKVRFRMEVTGEPTTLHDWEVLSAPDADRVETAVTVHTEDGGTTLGPTNARVLSYEELRQHASFPSDRATMEQALVQGPAGPLPGRRYKVRSADDPLQVVTFEFADSLPGPPVLMQTQKGDDIIQSMHMVARSGGPSSTQP
jgi:hypothetical protein